MQKTTFRHLQSLFSTAAMFFDIKNFEVIAPAVVPFQSDDLIFQK